MSTLIVGGAAAAVAVAAFLIGKKAAAAEPSACPPCPSGVPIPGVPVPLPPAQTQSAVCGYYVHEAGGSSWNLVSRVYASQATPSYDTQMVQAFYADPNLHPSSAYSLYKECKDGEGGVVLNERLATRGFD